MAAIFCAAAAAGARSEIAIPDCGNLAAFSLGNTYGFASAVIGQSDERNIMQALFGIPLVQWTSADFAAFREAILTCRAGDPGFDLSYLAISGTDDEYYRRGIDDMIRQLQAAQPVIARRLAALREAALLRREFDEINDKQEDSITAADVGRLFEIKDKLRDIEWLGYDAAGGGYKDVEQAALRMRQMVSDRAEAVRREAEARQRQLADRRAADAAEAGTLGRN